MCSRSADLEESKVELQKLSLDLHTNLLEMKWLLSLLLIDSSTTSKEGNSGQQMSAELLNKAFSTKPTQFRY